MTRQERDDRGSIVAFVILLSVCLLALGGLVAEGGAVMTARENAMTEAEQAARLGAAQASVASLHDGRLLEQGLGPIAVAESLMRQYGHKGWATRHGGVVTATVYPFVIRTPLLALAGLSSVTVSARASARAIAR